MPIQRNFDKLYESLNVHREKETPRIPESERPSNQCEPADHSMCDFLFEDYTDGRGLLILKGKRKRIDDELYKELTDIWWDVLSKNKDVTRFEVEFKTIAMDEGYTREEVDEYWRI